MKPINKRRVVLGGLVTGSVITLFDVGVNGVWFGADWNNALGALGKSEMSAGLVVGLVLTDFLVGSFLIFLYAAIQPRFRSGSRTATYVGLWVWVLISLLHALVEAPMGLFPVRLYAITVAAMLVALPLGTILGAALYRESDTG